MKKVTNFEKFVIEKREDVGKYNTVKKVIAKLGRRPSEQELAKFITDNYYDVTEVEREDNDPRADDKIADLVAFYKFDIDDWEIAWEDAQNESVVTENTVTFTLDDGSLDDKFLSNKSLSRNLDYKEDGGDTYYVLPKRDFDRLQDWADSSGYDIDEVIEVVDESVVTEASKINLKKGDKFKSTTNGEILFIIEPKGDGYDYRMSSDPRSKNHAPKAWFDMMIKTGKLVNESVVTESDINDPVLMAFRAAKMKREKELAKPKRKPLYGKQRQKAEDQLWDISQDLKDLYADRGQLLIDMEQEAEPEGGEVADRFGGELNDIESEIELLITKRRKLEMKLAESLIAEAYSEDDINMSYGFYGTINDHEDDKTTQKLFDRSVKDLMKEFKISERVALTILNSKMGRKAADQIIDGQSKTAVDALKDYYGKTLNKEIASIEKQMVTEGRIKYTKGKSYQSGGNWTVFKNGDYIDLDISVNNSAGWKTNPHDDRRETFMLMDAGKLRATLRFKEGNINAFAQKMWDLNNETTWGEREGLSAGDYGDIIRVWLDMNNAIN